MKLRLGIAAALVLLVAYGAFRAVPLLSGPEITLSSPTDYESVASDTVMVAGIARNTQNLTLNGGPLLFDESGTFATPLALPSGNAILTLTATDRFGKSETVRRTIFVP